VSGKVGFEITSLHNGTGRNAQGKEKSAMVHVKLCIFPVAATRTE